MAETNREQIAKLEAIYATNPGGRVFTHLAEAYRQAGDLKRANVILAAGLQRHPDYASAHVVLGRVRMDQGESEEAADSFRRVLELDPENRVALRTLGDLVRGARPAEALQHYRQLQSLDPSDEDLAQAIESLDRSVRGKPSEAGRGGTGSKTARVTPRSKSKPAAPPSDAPRTAESTRRTTREITRDWSTVEPEGVPDSAANRHEPPRKPAERSGAETARTRRLPASPTPDVLAELANSAMDNKGRVREDLPTETLAELYRTQGFYQRSAEVYRTLLKRRPRDARLKKRLKEVEELERLQAAGADEPDDFEATDYLDAPEAPGELEMASPGAADEAWVESESAWTGSATTADLPMPYAWELDPDEPPTGDATLRSYLDGILEWRSTGPSPDQGGQPNTEPEVELVLEPDQGFWGDAAEPWEESPPRSVNSKPGGPGRSESKSAGSASKPSGTRGRADLPASDDVDTSFDEWLDGDGMVSGPTRPAESPSLPAYPAAAHSGTNGGDEEADEDLEMFRSWLQSLKR